jgi:hypothetical protein
MGDFGSLIASSALIDLGDSRGRFIAMGRNKWTASSRRGSVGAALALLAVGVFTPSSAFAVSSDGSGTSEAGLVFMLPEEYSSRHEAEFGTAAPESVTGPEESPSTVEVSDAEPTSDDTPADGPALDPPGGGGSAAWYFILWKYTDKSGVWVPIRSGDSNLGYYHYAQPHNLYTQAPFRVIPNTTKPAVDQGAHIEYKAILANPNDLKVKLTVRIVVQAASRSAWVQPVVAFDLGGSVGQDARRACDVDVVGS